MSDDWSLKKTKAILRDEYWYEIKDIDTLLLKFIEDFDDFWSDMFNMSVENLMRPIEKNEKLGKEKFMEIINKRFGVK